MPDTLHYGGHEYDLPDDFDVRSLAGLISEARNAAASQQSVPILELPLADGGRIYLPVEPGAQFAIVHSELPSVGRRRV